MSIGDDGHSIGQPRRRGAAQWLRLLFLLAVLAFGALFIAHRWDDLRAAMSDARWEPLVGSVLIGAVGVIASMLAWRALLASFGSTLPVWASGRVFLLGQLGKYLPGSVWTLLAQVELGHDYKVPRKTTAAVSVLAIVVSVAIGLGFGVALLPFGSPEAARRYWWALLAVPFLVASLHPRVVSAILNRAFRLIRREPLSHPPALSGMLLAAGWQALSWLLLGLHAYLLVVGLRGDGVHALPAAVGGFAFAYCLGVLFLPVPAGAGVRETVLVLALAPVLSNSQALAVALLSRVILAFLDFLLAGVALVWRQVSKTPAVASHETR